MNGKPHNPEDTKPCAWCGGAGKWKDGIQYRFCGLTCYKEWRKVCNLGEKSANWAGGKPKCIDCDKTLARYKAPKKQSPSTGRCKTCWGISRRKDAVTRLAQRRIITSIHQIMRHHLMENTSGGRKYAEYSRYLGCSISDARKHIESQFWPHMNWGNQGFRGWHIDHIKPLSSFDLTKEEERQKAFHYTNLQPLWWFANLKKGRTFKVHEHEYSLELHCLHNNGNLSFEVIDKKSLRKELFKIENNA